MIKAVDSGTTIPPDVLDPNTPVPSIDPKGFVVYDCKRGLPANVAVREKTRGTLLALSTESTLRSTGFRHQSPHGFPSSLASTTATVAVAGMGKRSSDAAGRVCRFRGSHRGGGKRR